VVHGQGIAGALTAGTPTVLQLGVPIALFEEPVAALQWLGRADAEDVAEQLDEVSSRARGSSPLSRNLRAYATAHLADVTIETAAAALGFSVRNLQRRLSEHGTSFRSEVSDLRVQEATRMLAASDAKIADVAAAAGWSSTQHFASTFRKRFGAAPAEWRALHRR